METPKTGLDRSRLQTAALCTLSDLFEFHNFFQVEGVFYVNDFLEKLMFDELKQSCRTGGYGGFLPGMKQIGNVAALPGIVGVS